jgi:hypothetical protein
MELGPASTAYRPNIERRKGRKRTCRRLGYLEALEKSNRPVVVAVDDERMKTPGLKSHLYQQIGFLRKRPARTEAPTLHLFDLNWPDSEQACGLFMLDERLFEGATLSTVDGDDYFGLSLAFGPVTIR